MAEKKEFFTNRNNFFNFLALQSVNFPLLKRGTLLLEHVVLAMMSKCNCPKIFGDTDDESVVNTAVLEGDVPS